MPQSNYDMDWRLVPHRFSLSLVFVCIFMIVLPVKILLTRFLGNYNDPLGSHNKNYVGLQNNLPGPDGWFINSIGTRLAIVRLHCVLPNLPSFICSVFNRTLMNYGDYSQRFPTPRYPTITFCSFTSQ